MEHSRRPTGDGKSFRYVALLLLALSVPALLAAWVWLFPDHDPTPLLVVSVSAYESPLPPNSLAAEDAARFKQALDDYDNVDLVADQGSPRTEEEFLNAISAFLQQAEPGGPDKNVVMIYLSAHGVVNDSGQPCLLLPDDDPLNAATWTPMAKLFDALDQPAHLTSCQKVLFLDCHRIDDCWPMGVVVNTFGPALEAWLRDRRPTNCTVVSAASGLQSALAAPELGGTAFGHFVAGALRGAADREGDSDKVVTLQELEDYVRDRADAWAQGHRGARQTPRVLVSARPDAPLVDVAGSSDLTSTALPPSITKVQFREVYDRVDQLRLKHVHRQSPREWAYVQFLLERLDAEALAGVAYAEMAVGTLNKLRAALDELDSAQAYPPLEPLSLAMRQRLDPALDPGGLSAVWNAWMADPQTAKVPRGYYRAALFSWDRMAQDQEQLGRGDIRQALDFCQLAGDAAPVECVEMALLRLLDRFADWDSPAIADSSAPRDLLAARRLAEQLAAPVDARQHFAIEPAMQRLDERLGRTLDDVLVGDPDALYHAEEELRALLGEGPAGYRRASAQSALVLQALTARDDALAMAAPWHQWQVRRARNQQARSSGDVASLTRGVTELSALLDDVLRQSLRDGDDQTERRLRTLTEQVSADSARLLESYAGRVSAVRNQKTGPLEQAGFEAPMLLRSYLAMNEDRRLLHEQWFERLASRDAGTADSASETVGEASTTEEVSREGDVAYLRWLAAEGVQPLATLFDEGRYGVSAASPKEGDLTVAALAADASLEEAAAWLAAFGGNMRRRLASVEGTCTRLQSAAIDAISQQPAQEARVSLSQADAFSRALYPLSGVRPWFQRAESPARFLRRLDTQAWVAWQGARAVDDCWGSWQPGSAAARPYFETAAAHMAEEADGVCTEARFESAELRRQLQAAEQVIAAWQPLEVQELLNPVEGEAYLSHPVRFQGTPAMRPGQSAVYLTAESGELQPTYNANELPIRRSGVDTGGGRAAETATLDPLLKPEDLSASAVLTANALFRGHLRQAAFSIGRGVTVAWERVRPPKFSIMVRGDTKQISQLIFLVDCSGSMMESNRNKLQLGRTALSAILDQLVNKDEKFKIGMYFYGRRAGWQRNRNQAVFLNPILFNGPPGFDVERVFSPTLLDKWFAQEIKDKLAEAKPLGETPLYYALQQALGNFDEGIAGPRHLIAITDGVNFVADMPGFRRPTTTKNDVLKLLPSRGPSDSDGVRIDVVQFGATDATPRGKTGYADLKEIAQRSGGEFYEVNDADKLREVIEDSLRLDRYRVDPTGAGGEASDGPWKELGEATELPTPDPPADYRIKLQVHQAPAAEVRIEGGEALELVYQRSPANRLGHQRYMTDLRGDPIEAGSAYLAAHLPLLAQGRLDEPVFRVSIQQRDEREFSPRPEVIWAKIESSGAAASKTYYFLDREFEQNLPAPMLTMLARGWTGAKLARIELDLAWRSADVQSPWLTIPKLKTQTYQSHGATLTVESNIVGDDDLRVVVSEQHAPGAEDYPLNVELDPPPDKISRTFFESTGSVRHVFHYSVEGASPRLRASSRREIRAAGAGPIVFERVELPRG